MEYFLTLLVLILLTALIFSLLKRQGRQLKENQARQHQLLHEPVLDFSREDISHGDSVPGAQELKASQSPAPARHELSTVESSDPALTTPPRAQGTPVIAGLFDDDSEGPSPDSSSLHPAFDTQPTAAVKLKEELPRIRRLRDSGHLDRAMALCLQHLPKVQAFQQLLIVLREKVRSEVQAGSDANSSLTLLYHTACLAELFRQERSLPETARENGRVQQLLTQLEVDYQACGHHDLRILSKADRGFLEQMWGVPGTHRPIVEVMPARWWSARAEGAQGSP